MNSERLLIDEATTLDIAKRVDAGRALIQHSTAYLRYAASHVGHPELTGVLQERAESWAQNREDLAVLLDEITRLITTMVSEFTSVDQSLCTKVPAGSPDSIENRRQNGWEAMTGVYLNVH